MYFNAKKYMRKGVSLYLFIGIKSIGKTYWAIHKVIGDYEKKGWGFCWIYNTQDEVKDFKTELLNYLDPKKYSIIGYNVWDIEKAIIMGKLGSINTQHKLKNLEICKTLIFDEVDNGSRQIDKLTRWDKFTKIVSNMERKKSGFKTYCFMNAESKDNLIFSGLNIKYKGEKEILLLDGKVLIIALDKMEYFNQPERDKSLAYSLMKHGNSDIYKIAFGNEFARDDDRLITTEEWVKPKEYLYNLIIAEKRLTAYLDYKNNLIIDFDHFNGKKIKKLANIGLTRKSVVWECLRSKDNSNLATKWYNRIRKKKLLFTNYWIKDTILLWLVNMGQGDIDE